MWRKWIWKMWRKWKRIWKSRIYLPFSFAKGLKTKAVIVVICRYYNKNKKPSIYFCNPQLEDEIWERKKFEGDINIWRQGIDWRGGTSIRDIQDIVEIEPPFSFGNVEGYSERAAVELRYRCPTPNH